MTTTPAATDLPARPVRATAAFAPVPDEIDTYDLPVTGAIPPALTGRYLRNGPNPRPGEPSAHWFAGHGMLHGVRLAGGRAEWYRNRWVRTTLFEGTAAAPDRSRPPVLADTVANTHVVEHDGRLLALCEGGLPYEVTRELGTVGPVDFGGRLTTAMTAHPKQDPVTGELFFFGYGFTRPYVTYHRLRADGVLDLSVPIDVPEPLMMHDFAVTEHHVVWLDLPVVFDHDLARAGLMPFTWHDDHRTRLGVMSREGGPVRWYDVDPCYVFHVGNAHEDARGRVVVDGVRYGREGWASFWPSIGGADARRTGGHEGADLVTAAAASGHSVLHRWTLDPATGRAVETPLDDRTVEFPTLNEAHAGRDQRYLYAAGAGAVVKYDLATGGSTRHAVGEDRHLGEAVFVPAGDGRAEGRAEDDGWLLTIVTDHAGTASDLLVLDASDLAAAPVAAVHLPRAVPAGFHGSWIPDEDDEADR